MPQRAIEEMEAAERLSPDDPLALGFVGYAYAATGRRADALKVLQRLDELEKRRYVSRIARVYIYVGLGDKDKAFDWLEKAYQERSDSLAWFRFDPESKSLQNDPRFNALMRRSDLQSHEYARAGAARVGGSEPDWHRSPPRRTGATPKAFGGMAKRLGCKLR
jgi:tetratricopeptide (TPR) repeat protein